jgi:CubicO group peptidase (beta-lactamase class C family)
MKNISILFLSVIILLIGFEAINSQNVTDEIKSIEDGLMPPVLIKNEKNITYNIYDRMEHYHVPGVSIAVVKNRKLHWAKAYGIANTKTGIKINENTLFQAGSISKPVAALAILKLVEEGKVELDEDVNTYLDNWRIPDSKFLADEKVTIRRLLTHSAGMTVHGFPGYKQKNKFPTIEEVLEGKGNTPAIYVDTIPGSIFRYSGGGYTVMEYVVEKISGMPFEKYVSENILEGMDMKNSTYEQPLPKNLIWPE